MPSESTFFPVVEILPQKANDCFSAEINYSANTGNCTEKYINWHWFEELDAWKSRCSVAEDLCKIYVLMYLEKQRQYDKLLKFYEEHVSLPPRKSWIDRPKKQKAPRRKRRRA